MTMEIPALSFRAIDTRGTGVYDLVLLISGGCIVVGAVLPFVGPNPPRWGISFLVLAIGIAGLVCVFRFLPKTKYFVYFALDKVGIHHRTSPLSDMDLIPWTRVKGAKPRYAVGEGEFNGIELAVLSTTGYPDSRLLAMDYKYQIDQGVSAIREIVDIDSSSNRAFEGDALQAERL
jgi:hypothetical protein